MSHLNPPLRFCKLLWYYFVKLTIVSFSCLLWITNYLFIHLWKRMSDRHWFLCSPWLIEKMSTALQQIQRHPDSAQAIKLSPHLSISVYPHSWPWLSKSAPFKTGWSNLGSRESDQLQVGWLINIYYNAIPDFHRQIKCIRSLRCPNKRAGAYITSCMWQCHTEDGLYSGYQLIDRYEASLLQLLLVRCVFPAVW